MGKFTRQPIQTNRHQPMDKLNKSIQQRRFFDGKIETRAVSDTNPNEVYIRGYAALYDSPTILMSTDDCDYIEVIQKGAFDSCLANDVRCLIDHESELILGRGNNTRGAYESGLQTLQFGSDDKGLWYECRLDLSITRHNDLYKSMERGDITQSSFAAIFGDCKWVEETIDGKETCTRTVMTIEQLFDVSPVTFPAYEDTEVEAMKRSVVEDFAKLKATQNKGTNAALVARSRFNILKSKFNF